MTEGPHLIQARSASRILRAKHCPGREPAFLVFKRHACRTKPAYKIHFHRKTLRAINRVPEGRTVLQSGSICSAGD